jgi:hypothetical protein
MIDREYRRSDRVGFFRCDTYVAAGVPASLQSEYRSDANAALTQLNEAVDRLRAAGHVEHVPRGLLARAAFGRSEARTHEQNIFQVE